MEIAAGCPTPGSLPLPEAESGSARGCFGPSFLSPLAVGAVLSVSSVF